MRIRELTRLWIACVVGMLAAAAPPFGISDAADRDANKAAETTPPRRFPDFGYLPPPGKYEGRVFRLSQDYPLHVPPKADLPSFLTLDFRKQWREYLMAVREYCFDGNILGGDVEDDFQVTDATPVRWFHMPWQHYGPLGREGIHGLTKEAPVQPRQLAWSQTAAGQTYAVAFYNAFAASTIGRVWKDESKPELHQIAFPHGSVIFKLLFVDIGCEQVPSLKAPAVWQGYITTSFASTDRHVRNLNLIQMDIMVRDDQTPLGWVFGTFQYNGARKNTDDTSRWNNLIPVGIQWGNDPEMRDHHVNMLPVRTERNDALKETIINPDDDELPPTHLGWNGRLNGPVDNPMSSCMSCHAVAQVREVSPISPLFQEHPPVPGSAPWMRWFKNYECGQRFDKDVPTADFSLQLAISIKNFLMWQGEAHGIHANNYRALAEKAKAGTSSRYTETVIQNGKAVEQPKIQRNFPPMD